MQSASVMSMLADALELQQFAFHHHLREADQQIENLEIALAQGDLEGLHVEPVAGQHAGVIAPLARWSRAGRGASRAASITSSCTSVAAWIISTTAPSWMARGSAVADQLGGKQQQRGPQPFAAARLQVLADGGDGVHRRHRFRGDLLFDLLQVVLDQVENLSGGEGLPQLA